MRAMVGFIKVALVQSLGYLQRPSLPPAMHHSRCCSMSLAHADGPTHILTSPNFLPCAAELRAVFDDAFAEPRQAHPMRFVWDYWHVPGQYTLHRTMASDYFDEDLFAKLTDALTTFGQEELGCRSISPPWLSFYVDGCEQSLHADVPQGPFAYVLSLTLWDERAFTGGETQILRPQVLDYWRDFDSSRGLELNDLLTEVPPLFNQLTVFDARVPHAVQQVQGTRDPRRGRVVLHGWFTEPETHFSGGMAEDDVANGLAPSLTAIQESLGQPTITGLLSVRMLIDESGELSELTHLIDTLVADPAALAPDEHPDEARLTVLKTVEKELGEASFAPSTQGTKITIPFVFD
uniref:Prolyl 4-hydroxylase alpha subunit Fe(2+) 2OG dioxygenase domain-containing protein n=1 Tax=Coccolithus braarudii TaxID=221442 RepID=A0A7S0PY49_9EUKA